MEMGLETHLEKFNAAEKMFVLMRGNAQNEF